MENVNSAWAVTIKEENNVPEDEDNVSEDDDDSGNNGAEVENEAEKNNSEVGNEAKKNDFELGNEAEKNDSEVGNEAEVRVKTEIVDTEDFALSSTEENAGSISVGMLVEEMNKSPGGVEDESAEEGKSGDEGKAATDGSPDKPPKNASLRAKLRSLVEKGKHFLQCTDLVPVEEFERQVSIYKELAEVQLKSFNKELLRSCPIITTDGDEGLIFKVGDLLTCPLEICYSEKYVTHAGFNEVKGKFSFSLGYKKFGKSLPTRESFNPAIKKCYEVILKYVHKSGRPFHVLRRKPPGFWSAVTIVCNKKKELLVQLEVHVSENQYKKQSCELEKLKFLNCFTDGPGKDCNVVSLQWKQYLGSDGFTNVVLYGKEFLIERFGDLNLRVYPDDFLISKPSGVDLVCRMVKELLGLQEMDPKVTILEIGTGTGIIGMQLSKVCKRVHMLDRMDKVSIEHAEENVKLNGIPNCFVHHEEIVQSIKKVTSMLNENDKVYAVIHNNMDSRRIAPEMDGLASNYKIKKIVYLSFDHKVRGIKQIRALCCPSKDTFVPVKVIPLVIIPCYSDVDLAILLVRQSLLEGRTIENELRILENTSETSASVNVAKKLKRGYGGNDFDDEHSDSQEPLHKKQKLLKQQFGGKKGQQKFNKKGRRQRFDRWQGGNRWQESDQWQGDDEWQESGDTQEMNIRKVGFPGYRPPSFLSENKSIKMSEKSHFQQNEKWSKRQQHPQSWGQPQQMNRNFQQSQSNNGNRQSQFSRLQGINYKNFGANGYQNHWRGHQQYNSLQQQPFRNNSQYQFTNSQNQRSNSSQYQFTNSQNQRSNSSHNQQYNSQYNPQSQRYNSPQNQPYCIQNQQYTPQNQQYNAQNQQYSAQNQQYNAQNQQYNAQNQQYSAQNQQYSAQNQQYSAQNQQCNPQNQQCNPQNQQCNPQNQQYNPQNQQYNNQNQQYNPPNQQYNNQNQQYSYSQNLQYSSSHNQHQYSNSGSQQIYTANQFNHFQSQQFNNSQNFLNSSQQNLPQQQVNSPLQMNYGSSLKSAGQQTQHDVAIKSNVPQVSFDAAVKSGDQQNYDASENSGGFTRQFATYGMDYNSAHQVQSYGTSSWGGHQNSVYNYGYAGSGSSMAPTFNVPSTSNLAQQNSWTPYLPQTKLTAGDTSFN